MIPDPAQEEAIAMKRKLTVLGIPLTVASIMALAPGAFAAGTANSFNLTPPNTATAPSGPSMGDTIRVTGSGTFDASSAAIVASGSFTHTHSNGTVVARGTWVATGFTSFVGFGGPSPGFQGGQLFITATLFPDGESPHTGIPMVVTCLFGSPPAGLEEGTTVGDFTHITGGTTIFHID
jgi:hypothetical protein